MGDGRRAGRDVAAVGRATVARIDPRWVEPLAEHLRQRTLRRAALGPQARGSVVATERVTLYGLPIVAGRTVAYGRDRPGAVARAVHPPRAGRGRLGDAPRVLRREPRACVEEVEALEDRARRRDILVDDEALFDFYDARIPADVVSGAHFDRWWRDERRARPRPADLHARAAGQRGARRDRRRAAGRTTWKQGDLELRAELPLRAGRRATTASPCTCRCARCSAAAARRLRVARARRCASELVTALIRALPKELRRPLVPVPEIAAAVLARAASRGGEPLLDALARASSSALRGVRVPPRRVGPRRGCPPHLRMTFRVEDERGRRARRGRGPRRAARARCARGCARSWPPRRATLERTALTRVDDRHAAARRSRCPAPARPCARYPALVDEGDDGRRARARDAGRPARARCAPARAGCCADRPLPRPLRAATGSARRRSWRSPARRTAAWRGARRRDRRRASTR